MFRIITFNVLAESYASPRNYAYVDPPSALSWAHRSKLINRIIDSSNAEIILLQEVDHPSDLFQALKTKYETHFEQRPESRMDGLFTAWNKSRYRLIDSERINYNDLCKIDTSFKPDPRYLRHNIGLIYLLYDKQTNKHIMIANTHLYWNPSCEDVKLLQVRHLICSCSYIFKRNQLDSRLIPFFLGGDFNSVPQSDVLSFLTTSKYFLRFLLLTKGTDQNCLVLRHLDGLQPKTKV